MAEEIGSLVVRVGLDGSNFDKGMKNLNAQMNLARSEMRALGGSFDKSGKSIEGLRFKQDGLSKQYQIQGARVQELSKQYDQLVQAHGKESDAALRAGAKLNNAVGSYEKMGNQLGEVTKELAFQESKWGKATASLESFSQSMNKTGDEAISRGKKLTTGLTLPIAGLGAIALKTGINFQAQMSKVQAISGATGKDFEALRGQAKALGRDTIFSATEAGEGMEYLALAGWKTKDIMAGMPGLLDLAAAGSMDLGRAADITSDTMQAFGIEASKAGHSADVFAYAQANANTNVEQMGEAMKYAAPVANSFKWSLEETAAAQMALADSGLKGSIAGQAFASSLTRLAKPSENTSKIWKSTNSEFFTAEGQLKKMPDLVKELEKATKDMTEEQKAGYLSATFGAEAYKHWAVLIERGSDELRDMTTELENSDGTAKKMAKTMTDNAQGAIKEFMSAVENLSIMASEHLLPAVTDLIKLFTKWTLGFAEMSPEAQKTVLAVAGLVAAMGPMNLLFGTGFKMVGKFAGGLAGITGKFGRMQVQSGAATGALSAFGGAAATTRTGALRTAGSLATATGSMSRMSKGAGLAKVAMGALGGPIGLLATVGLPALIAGGVALVTHLNKEAMPSLDSFGNKVSDSTTKAYLGYKDLNDKATSQLNELFWSGDKITKEGTESLIGLFDQMTDQIAASMETKFNDSYKIMQDFFANSKHLSKKEQDEILKDMKDGHEKRKKQLEDDSAREKEIMNTASKEKRALTKSEQAEINAIQKRKDRIAVESMSKSEQEQKAILERLKVDSGKITARQAADTVQNSEKARKGSVKEANKNYESQVSTFIKMRDETGEMTKEQADRNIKEAKRQRDETVKKAESMHKNVVKQAKEQAEGQEHYVNWTTGEVKSHWDMLVGQTADMINDFSGAINWVLKHIGLESLQIPRWEAGGRAKPKKKPKKNAYGTGGHPGGDMILGDGRGFNAGSELVMLPSGQTFLSAPRDTLYPNMPKGTEVLPAYKTKQVMQMSGTPKYAWGIGKKVKKFGKAIEDNVFTPIGEGLSQRSEVIQETTNHLLDKSGKAMLDLGLKAVGALIPKKETGFATGQMARGAFDYLKKNASSFLETKRDEVMPMGDGINFGGSFMRTSGFGQRWGRPHNGLDFAAPAGTPIRAQAGGTVLYSGYGKAGSGYGGYGNVVHIQGAGGLSYLYGHNSKNLVATGANVSKGGLIGLVGSTGDSTGPHVHFEVRKDGKAINPDGIMGGASVSASAWKSMIKRASVQMGESITESELNGIVAQIHRESRGNQSITQSPLVRDINTLNGNPARGLLQYIPQTFQKYAAKGHGNIYSGYDQLLAFFNNTNWRKDLPYGRRGWGPTGSRKYATGGKVWNGLYQLGEEGYPEWIIPTDPARHDDATKLLAHATNDISRNKRPNQLPNISGGDDRETIELLTEQNRLLRLVVDKNSDVYMDGRIVGGLVEPHVTQKQNKDRKKAQRGWG